MTSSVWRAAGNTYRVVEPGGDRLDAARIPGLARGTDGVLEILHERTGAVEIAIWNPDGSQAELSGNGTRIVAVWHSERSGADGVDVTVGTRVVRTTRLPSGEVEQDLGSVVVGAPETLEGVTFVPVDVGNPHAVVLGNPDDIRRVGPLLETHERFPNRTNVQVARVVADGEVSARVWERGVGETASSGTSAVAVAAATHRSGEVVVHFPGGDLVVRLEDGRATLRGTAERVG